MGIVVLRMACEGLTNFEDGKLAVDFVTEKRVTAEQVESGIVSKLFGRIYKLNALAFAGINATGKTSVLSLLSNLLQTYVGNGSLSYSMRIRSLFESSLKVESFFYREETASIYKLVSVIKRDDVAQSLLFSDEQLYEKAASPAVNKGKLFDFSEDDLVLARDGADTRFLKDEDSIFSVVMNSYKYASRSVQDLRSITNRNWIPAIALDLVVPFAQYLDPAIEYIRVKEDAAPRVVFELKFKRQEEPIAVDSSNLELYLSSGTIKGVSCLSAIAAALATGGYVVIDEIENHLNKTIVVGLIEMFTSTLNCKGATILFSTHYSEIIDCVDRSDGIYLLDKSEVMRMRKFSVAAGDKDRKDKKKSDLILSGVLAKAPSYPAYRRMTKKLEAFLQEGDGR